MSRMSDQEILLSRAEDGDTCPICQRGTVVIVASARVFWVKCRGECGNSTMSQNPPQDGATIARRWGADVETVPRIERERREFFLVVACVTFGVAIAFAPLTGAHEVVSGFIDAFWNSVFSPIHPLVTLFYFLFEPDLTLFFSNRYKLSDLLTYSQDHTLVFDLLP